MRIELSLTIFRAKGETIYKITKRIPSLGVSETRMFDSLAEARLQFDEWRLHLL